MRRRILLAVFALLVAALAIRVVVVARDMPGHVTAARFETLRADLPQMRAFLNRMPKGGDLHTHLSGAVYAERFVAWAVDDGLCLRLADMTILPRPEGGADGKPCGADAGVVPVADAVSGRQGQQTYDLLINALSMRWFLPSQKVPSGHDQFFATFGKFGPASGGQSGAHTLNRIAEMTADQLRHYDETAVQHAEFMVTLIEGDERRQLAKAIGEENDPAAMLAALDQAGMPQMVAARAQNLKDLVARVDAVLGCGADRTKPGCDVSFSYIAQVNRNSPPAEVFAQTAFSVALARAVPRIVSGINYVGPEDYRISLRDYRTHMQWIRFLARADVPVALHAGELWLGLVPPDELDFHIREAVEVAGARRIGHGTAIPFERDTRGLLEEMRRRGVTVEIALTSSDVILGVRGREHPIRLYLASGVPVVLATDDAGVSRIDLTNEYFRAARDHGIGYRQLKSFARNAITHAFLSEEDKRRELERLDAAFAAFEQARSAELSARARWGLFARAVFLPSR